jgi:acyl dehydratase
VSEELGELPDAVTAWIGERRYPQVGEFDVERGYVLTSCASVENGNPIFWDEKSAREIAGGWIAPPSMLDLKQALDLPEAIMTENTIVFHEPVRPGDRLETCQVLRSISPPKRTKLGLGRFWVIDVEYVNQRGEAVGTESYTGFGYRRGA